MSFPNIPDVQPCIDIKQEDAVNMLLASIAMEEMSISKLIDAETQKVLCVINDCKHKDFAARDAIHINKSVNDTIKNLIKLQMLLQFKLENVREFIPPHPCPPCPHPCPPCPPPCPMACCCGLKGTGKGFVTNCCDEFDGHLATLYAFIFNQDERNRTLRYAIKDEDSELRFFASGRNIKIKCPCHCANKIAVHGKGHMEIHSQCHPDISGHADFVLTVEEKMTGILEFRMEIEAECHSGFRHDSGNVRVKDSCSDLRMVIVC